MEQKEKGAAKSQPKKKSAVKKSETNEVAIQQAVEKAVTEAHAKWVEERKNLEAEWDQERHELELAHVYDLSSLDEEHCELYNASVDYAVTATKCAFGYKMRMRGYATYLLVMIASVVTTGLVMNLLSLTGLDCLIAFLTSLIVFVSIGLTNMDSYTEREKVKFHSILADMDEAYCNPGDMLEDDDDEEDATEHAESEE